MEPLAYVSRYRQSLAHPPEADRLVVLHRCPQGRSARPARGITHDETDSGLLYGRSLRRHLCHDPSRRGAWLPGAGADASAVRHLECLRRRRGGPHRARRPLDRLRLDSLPRDQVVSRAFESLLMADGSRLGLSTVDSAAANAILTLTLTTLRQLRVSGRV